MRRSDAALRVLAGAAAAAAVAAIVVGRGDRRADGGTASSAAAVARDDRVGALRAEVEDLRRRVAGLTHRVTATAPAAAPAPAPAAVRTDELAPEELAAASDVAARSLIARFDGAFARDAVDPDWSADAEQRIRGRLADATLQLQVDEVACRATLCRVSVRYASAEAREQGQDLLPSLVPWTSGGIIRLDEADPTRAVLYKARSVELLPAP